MEDDDLLGLDDGREPAPPGPPSPPPPSPFLLGGRGGGGGAGAAPAPSNGGFAETSVADPHFGEVSPEDEDLQAMLCEDAFYREQLEAILLAPHEEAGRRHYSVNVRFGDLAAVAPTTRSSTGC